MIDLIRKRFHPLWWLRRSPIFRKLQLRHDVTVYKKLRNSNIKVAMKLLRDASWIFDSSHVEPEVTFALESVCRTEPLQVFWDVGAHIGFYSWWLSSRIEGIEILAFEPDPTNYDLILATIKKSKLRRVRAMNVAVSESVGWTEFLRDEASGAGGSISSVSSLHNPTSLQSHYALSQHISVATVSLDSVADGGGNPPGLIKIDVEGAEHLVLAGAKRLIETHAPIIVMETHQPDLLESLAACHYNVLSLDPTNVICVPRRAHALFDDLAKHYSVSVRSR